MDGLVSFSPVTSRVSARQPSYFFLRRQKKVTKKKASHVRAASRSLALLAAFGALANSLRSNSASALIRTLLRCSARPNGGFEYLTARPLRELRPGCSSASRTSPRLLVRCAHLAGVGLPHFSRLTSHKGTARRATTPHSSRLTSHHGQPQGLPLRPHSYSLTPHPSPLTPHPSPLTPHSSPLTPHSSLLTPHPSPLTPHSSLLTPHPSLLTPHSSLLTPHPSLLTPHSSPLTPHSSLNPPRGNSPPVRSAWCGFG